MREISALILFPQTQSLAADSQIWLSALEDVALAGPARFTSPAHSSRPYTIEAHTRSLDGPKVPSAPWQDQMRELPLITENASIAIEPLAGACSHLISLQTSAAQCLAISSILGRLSGGQSFGTVAIEPTYNAIKMLSDPFGRQIAGRVLAMTDAAGIDLYMIARGPAARRLLEELGFRTYTDIVPAPIFWASGSPASEAGQSEVLAAAELSGTSGLKKLARRIAQHELHGAALKIDASDAHSAGWVGFAEEALLSGMDVSIVPPKALAAAKLTEMACQASRVLSVAGAGDSQNLQASRLWSLRKWKIQTAPALWLNSVIRQEHDRLGFAVKTLNGFQHATRIDVR